MKAESQTNKTDMEWKGPRTQTRTKGTRGGLGQGTVIFLGPPWAFFSAHLLSRSCQSSVAWSGGGAGLRRGGGASESIFWPRGLDWPAAPTCSAAERGRVTPSGSASPASGEVRASPLPLQRFAARLCLQGRGGGPAAQTGGLRSQSPPNRRQSPSSDGGSEREPTGKAKDHCRSDSASQVSPPAALGETLGCGDSRETEAPRVARPCGLGAPRERAPATRLIPQLPVRGPRPCYRGPLRATEGQRASGASRETPARPRPAARLRVPAGSPSSRWRLALGPRGSADSAAFGPRDEGGAARGPGLRGGSPAAGAARTRSVGGARGSRGPAGARGRRCPWPPGSGGTERGLGPPRSRLQPRAAETGVAR